MEKIVTLTQEEIDEIKKINNEYSLISEEKMKVSIEKIKVQDSLNFLEKSESEIENKLRNTMSKEASFISTITEKYGQIQNINVNEGSITLK